MDFLSVAIAAAKKAGELFKARKMGEVKEKLNPGDLVTQVDKDASNLIIEMLKKHYPEHVVISEEEAFNNVPQGYVWAIDPLDGTLPYLLGFNYSTVSIALLKDHKPILGVIYQPLTDKLYSAEKGKGAFLNGKKIKVNTTKDLAHSTATFEHDPQGRVENAKKLFLPIVQKVRYVLTSGCGSYDLINIAEGTLELFLHANTCLWDIAAAHVIVTEAGGKATDLNGEQFIFNKKKYACIFSNGIIHNEVLKTIKPNEV